MKDKLEQLIDSLLLDMSNQKAPSTRKSEFRVSSFPYCPIRSLLFHGEGDETYSSEFYTSIGTAVHATLQKWIARGNFSDKVFACWKSKQTGEIIGPCFKRDIPKKYSNQEFEMEYEEITVAYRGLSGHIDLVIEILPGKYIVIDFKTTNLGGKKRKHPMDWKSKYPASKSSIIQISTYCTLLEKLYGLNIVAWCLVYIDRGDVISGRHNFFKVLRPWNKAKHKDSLEKIDAACDNNARLVKLKKILDSDSEEYSPKADKILKSIIEHRPCTDEDSYDEWMHYKFHQGWTKKDPAGVKKGVCIMKDKCLKGSKTTYKAVVSKL